MASYSSIRYNFDPPKATTSALVGTSVQKLIKTVTVSSSTSTVSFIHGSNDVVFDSTYKSYLFKVIEVHVSLDSGVKLGFQGTTDGSNFTGITNNSNYVQCVKEEDDGYEALQYDQNFFQAVSLQIKYLSTMFLLHYYLRIKLLSLTAGYP